MQIGRASGFQVAFAIMAVFLLAAPVSKYIGQELHLNREWFDVLARGMQLFALALLIAFCERVRPGAIGTMLRPIPPDRRAETAIVTTAHVLLPFAVFATVMLWHWITGDARTVEHHFPTDIYHAAGEARALSAPGLLFLFVTVAIAPLVEEIAFRGLLYRAWEEAWGWIPAMLASSIMFGLLHSGFYVQAAAGVLFVALYRRTGTLVAPVIAHAVGNACVWYWLVGRFYMPDPSLPAGDLASWQIHLALLVGFVIAGPAYLFMSRNAYPENLDEQPVPA